MVTQRSLEGPWDVVVAGGGPAGSTVAALLARAGHKVLVLEKDAMPRYHIGESLIPFCWYTLDRLGVVDRLQSMGFPKKYSVQFARETGEISAPFYFHQHRDHPSSQTWQVVRADFDKMLLDHAAECGASVVEGVRVTGLLRDGDGPVRGVTLKTGDGTTREVRAKFTLDATGRDALSIGKLGWRVRDPKLDKVAVWSYWRGAVRDPGLDAGATTVAYVPEKGWFWFIPLPGDVTSVGLVGEASYVFRDGLKDPAAILERELPSNAWVQSHLAPAERFGESWVTGEYSYRSRHAALDGLLLVGDAFAFLDPVFSSGVFLALKSGELAADAVDAALKDGDVSASRFTGYADTLCNGIEAMRKLVYAFYDPRFHFGRIAKEYPHLRGRLTDCLIGDLFTDFDPLWDAVGRFATLPPPLAHGRPLVNAAT